MYKIVEMYNIYDKGRISDNSGNIFREITFVKHAGDIQRNTLYFLENDGFCVPAFDEEKGIEGLFKFSQFSKLAVKRTYTITKL